MELYLVPTETMLVNEDFGCMVRRMCQSVCQSVNILFLLQHFPDPHLFMGERGNLVNNPLGTQAIVALVSHGTLLGFC